MRDLHVVEAVVVGVEDGLGGAEVERVVGADAPRQLEHAVEPRADPALLGRLGARALQPVDLLVDEVLGDCRPALERLQLGAVLADDVVVALAELLADGRQLLAQQVLALLLVDALGDVVADRSRRPAARPGAPWPTPARASTRSPTSTRAEHLAAALLGQVGPADDGVGQRAGLEAGAQDLGEAAGARAARRSARGCRAARGRCPRRAASGGGRAGPRRRRRSAPRSDVWTAVMRARDSTCTMATGSPVGSEPMSGTWATTPSLTVTGTQQHPAVTGATGRLDGAAGLIGHEGERDDRPGQDGGRQLGERQPGGGRRVGDGGRLAHVSKDIDAVGGSLRA